MFLFWAIPTPSRLIQKSWPDDEPPRFLLKTNRSALVWFKPLKFATIDRNWRLVALGLPWFATVPRIKGNKNGRNHQLDKIWGYETASSCSCSCCCCCICRVPTRHSIWNTVCTAQETRNGSPWIPSSPAAAQVGWRATPPGFGVCAGWWGQATLAGEG